MMKTATVAGLFLMIFLAVEVQADEPRWGFQFGSGLVWNSSSHLTVKQDGKKVVDETADWETRPLEKPYYYLLRIGRTVAGSAWELELLHHKIYLKDPPANTDYFSVSHGYNLLLFNRAWETPELIYRVGGGIVVAHPESRINGKTYDRTSGVLPFDLGGPAFQGAVEKRLTMENGVTLALEAKITAAYAILPVKGGTADVPNLAAHLLAEIGWGEP